MLFIQERLRHPSISLHKHCECVCVCVIPGCVFLSDREDLPLCPQDRSPELNDFEFFSRKELYSSNFTDFLGFIYSSNTSSLNFFTGLIKCVKEKKGTRNLQIIHHRQNWVSLIFGIFKVNLHFNLSNQNDFNPCVFVMTLCFNKTWHYVIMPFILRTQCRSLF